MNIRFTATFVCFWVIFLGLLSLTGNTHVAEFYGSLVLAIIGTLIFHFKLLPESKKRDAED